MTRPASLIAAAVCLQVAVPTWALLDAPRQFGFQMYSGLPGSQVTVRDAGGRNLEVTYYCYTGRSRPDVDFRSTLPGHLCAHVAGAAVVELTWRGETRETAC